MIVNFSILVVVNKVGKAIIFFTFHNAKGSI